MGIGGREGGFGKKQLRSQKNVQMRKSRIGGTSCADVQMKNA